ncbi:MAG: hypothetical protein AAF591_23175 [Verrucomicrobiota bacterium]
MVTHEWRHRTEEGELRFVRAKKHGDTWTLQARLKSEEHWTPLDPIPRTDLEQLRDILHNKYKRRRVPYKDIEQIDALLEHSQ